MSINQYSTSCRLCLQCNTTFYEIFSNKSIEEKIQKVFKFPVTNNYRLPHLICLTCHETLTRFDEFVQLVGGNQEYLNRQYGLSQPETVPVDVVTIDNPTVQISLKLPDEPNPASECGEPTEGVDSAKRTKRKNNPRSKGDELIRQHMELYCDICGESSERFEDYSTLLKHFKVAHETRGYAVCCGRKFNRKDKLMDHITLHINPDAFKCNDCGHRSKSALLLDIHRRQHSKAERLYVCDMCDKVFVTKSQLYNHLAKHGLKRHVCDVCGKAFGHKFILARHRIKHDEPSKFICEICAKPLSSAFNLKLHLQNHDTKTGNKVQCSFCAKWFNNAETLRSHFNARHKDQREHRCEQCDKLYPTGSALLEHVRMVHRKQPNHCCHLCDKRFFKQSVLKEHVKRSHSGPNPKALFQCEFCDKEYLHSNNYFFHRKKAHPEEYAQLRRDREQQRVGLDEGSTPGDSSTPTDVVHQ